MLQILVDFMSVNIILLIEDMRSQEFTRKDRALICVVVDLKPTI